ncbi:MAG: hypothetical protein PGN07_09595 [Aeromicrobium erythreum]
MLRIGLVGVVAVLAATLSACSDAPAPGGGEQFVSAQLPGIAGPRRVNPDFTRTIYAEATLDDFAGPLDACRGPIAISIPTKSQVLVSEHDYCGGSAWISRLKDGSTIRISGDGVEAGFYEVTVREVHPRGKTRVRDLPRTPLVLQTCISKADMVLVGLQPILNAVPA